MRAMGMAMLALAGLSLCACKGDKGGKEDFATLCTLAAEVEKDSSVPDAQKVSAWIKRTNPKVAGDAAKTMQVMGSQSAPIGQRYRTMVSAAKEAGLEGWSCEPLERILTLEEKPRMEADAEARRRGLLPPLPAGSAGGAASK